MSKITNKAALPESFGFAECETVTAGPTTPSHIRQLTGSGLFKSGGADTAALCGRKVSWDIKKLEPSELPRILANQTATCRVCARCAELSVVA
jgi:hypothetical protein